MAIATLTPQTAVVDIMINSQSYKQFFSSARVRGNLPQLDATVFANESVGDFIAGIERLTLDFGGVVKKGVAGAGPLLPLSNYQGKTFSVQYDTGCTITGTLNLSEGEIGQVVGQIRPITASGFSVGAFVVTWVIT